MKLTRILPHLQIYELTDHTWEVKYNPSVSFLEKGTKHQYVSPLQIFLSESKPENFVQQLGINFF